MNEEENNILLLFLVSGPTLFKELFDYELNIYVLNFTKENLVMYTLCMNFI